MERLQHNDEGPLEHGQIDKHKPSDRFSVKCHQRRLYINIFLYKLLFWYRAVNPNTERNFVHLDELLCMLHLSRSPAVHQRS